MSYQDYFTESQHNFMIAVSDVLEACESIVWDENEVFDASGEALNDWEYADAIPTSPDRLKFGKTSFKVKGKRVDVYLKECHQWKSGQRHLRTYERETYISSRWYQCHIEGHKSFRVKLTLGNELACFQRAIHKALNLCVTD